MNFSEHAWAQAAPILRAIEQHPFIAELASGALSSQRFHYYMAQDALYLDDYARALALAASQAPRADEVEFWSTAAVGVIVAERQLHAQFVAQPDPGSRSPTCTAYTSYLLAFNARGAYAQLVAAVLPCFWIYEHVGQVLARSATELRSHPYRAWIETYANPDFAAASARARSIADRAVTAARDRDQATAVFLTACRYEWMFWDAAWRMEAWPI